MEMSIPNGERAIHFAISNGHEDLSCYLVEASVSLDDPQSTSSEGTPYLPTLTGSGRGGRRWGDLGASDDDGCTPIIIAAVSSRGSTLKYLLEYINGSTETFWGEITPLLVATIKSDEGIVRQLLESGLPVEYIYETINKAVILCSGRWKAHPGSSASGLTEALPVGSARRCHLTVQLLVQEAIRIRQRARLTAVDSVGSTPIVLAVRKGQSSLGFIKRHMADPTRGISRRPSLLSSAAQQDRGGLTKEDQKLMSIHIVDVALPATGEDASDPEPSRSPALEFWNDREQDKVGSFYFYGFVDFDGAIWFVKHYQELGWLYRGQLDNAVESRGFGRAIVSYGTGRSSYGGLL
ncbi:hypothetical protein CHU98_g5926 [Xylaria longipes]|nr:hypothetical protein CHU98_g5926 [Xylaria longipes]